LQLIGILQVASFHPDYCFAGVSQDAAENFTNRAPFPILHLIREQSIARVLSTYPDPDNIPERNIAKAEQLGSQYFQDYFKKMHENYRTE
jgi:hypothetical protein